MIKVFILIITNNYRDVVRLLQLHNKKIDTYIQKLFPVMATNKDTYTHHNYLDLLTDDAYHKPRLITTAKHDKYYVDKVGNDLTVRQYLLLVVPHLPTLINERKSEFNKWSIQLIMQICLIDPNERPKHPPNLFHCS